MTLLRVPEDLDHISSRFSSTTSGANLISQVKSVFTLIWRLLLSAVYLSVAWQRFLHRG